MELVSQSEYARMRGLWRSTVTRQIASGVIPVHGDRRMMNPEEADRCRAELLNPFKGARRGLRAAENVDSAEGTLPDYHQGAAFITNAFRHPARVESFAEVCLAWLFGGPGLCHSEGLFPPVRSLAPELGERLRVGRSRRARV